MKIENIVNKILDNKNDLIEDSFCYTLFEDNIFDFQKLDILIENIDRYKDCINANKIDIKNPEHKKVNETLCWMLSSCYKALIHHYNKNDLYTIKQFALGEEEDATNAIDKLGEHIFAINITN